MRQAAPNKQDKRAYSALNRTGLHIRKTFCFLSLAGRALPTRLSLRSHFSCARQMRHHFYIRRRGVARGTWVSGVRQSCPPRRAIFADTDVRLFMGGMASAPSHFSPCYRGEMISRTARRPFLPGMIYATSALCPRPARRSGPPAHCPIFHPSTLQELHSPHLCSPCPCDVSA